MRIDTTTICGTDLHILNGDVPAVTDGRVLGHEAVAARRDGAAPGARRPASTPARLSAGPRRALTGAARSAR
ncbi:MAG TPA: alcohol dehydrogenase catalytic domain-containing protein [Streptosporangiaceae bacterium]